MLNKLDFYRMEKGFLGLGFYRARKEWVVLLGFWALGRVSDTWLTLEDDE